MTKRLTIALDAMGGDSAPEMVIRGAAIARTRFPDASFLLFGPEPQLAPLMTKHPKLAPVVQIRHTDGVVEAHAKPSAALRQGRQSSMGLAVEAVAEGQADCAVSAGNTGALMALSKFMLKTLPGIERPAIAGFFPTMRGESVMLDLGANIQCDASNLVQFAVMGEVFARTALGVIKPTIGLLNVGSEELKGHDILRTAHGELSEAKLPGQFHGFIEGTDIAAGLVDVVVTDGFSGNVALKTAEGTSKLISSFIRQSFKHSPLARLGYLFARPAMNKLRARLDPRRYNGAIFLGLGGIVVKSHGGTDALGFATAVGTAVDMVQQKALDKIREDFAHLHEGEAAPSQAV